MAGQGRGQAGAAGKTRSGRTEREGAGVQPGRGAAVSARNGRSKATQAAVENVPTERLAQSARESGAAGGQMIDLDFLRGLVGAVDASGIDSIEIVRAGTRIRISKTPPMPAALPAPTLSAAPNASAASVSAAAPQSAAAAVQEASLPVDTAEAQRTELYEVKSPMVGTYYRAPAPEAPPYVEVGSHVTKGQTLCILEAMKLMNELESEVDGIVREVLVENADPVEFGQVLFRIELKH